MPTIREASATSPSGRLAARPLQPFGASIAGDLSADLAADDRAWLSALLDAHSLLVAADQALSLAQQMVLLGSFGPVLGSDQDLAYVDAAEGALGNHALAFHSDMAFTRSPYAVISLHAVDVIAGESCTRFANGMLGFERLDHALRERLGKLTATWASSPADRRIPYNARSRFRHSRCPVLRHPRSGRPILYVNEGQTARIEGMGEAESEALLGALFEHLYAPDAIYQHDWRPGDIVIWDNLALQHGRPSLASVTRRRLQRASVAAESLFQMHPDFCVEPA